MKSIKVLQKYFEFFCMFWIISTRWARLHMSLCLKNESIFGQLYNTFPLYKFIYEMGQYLPVCVKFRVTLLILKALCDYSEMPKQIFHTTRSRHCPLCQFSFLNVDSWLFWSVIVFVRYLWNWCLTLHAMVRYTCSYLLTIWTSFCFYSVLVGLYKILGFWLISAPFCGPFQKSTLFFFKFCINFIKIIYTEYVQ